MDPAHPILTTIKSASFAPLTSTDIRSISVLQITNPQLLDNNNAPSPGGLYDSHLGPVERGDICQTCRLKSYACPGHFGHIELSVPVFHPLWMVNAVTLLRGTCLFCHRFLAPEVVIAKYIAKLTLLENGLPLEADNVDNFASSSASSSHKKGKSGKRKAEDDDEADADEADANVIKATLHRYVRECLEQKRRREASFSGSLGKERDDHKLGMCFDRRRKVIAEFVKQMPRKKCERCGAVASRLKKEGHVKVVEYSLMPKQQAFNDAAGLRKPNVLRLERRVLEKKRAGQVKRGKQAEHIQKRARLSKGGYNVDPEDSDAPSSDAWGNDSAANGRRHSDSDSVDSDDERGEGIALDVDEDMSDVDFQELAQDAAAAGDVDGDVLMEEAATAATTATGRAKQTERMMLPEEARAHLRLLFRREPRICALLYATHGPVATYSPTSRRGQPDVSADMFFMDVVPVPPTKFRPAAMMNGQTMEAAQNVLLTAILQQTFKVRDLSNDYAGAIATARAEKERTEDPVVRIMEEKNALEKQQKIYAQVIEACIGLQIAVNSLMDTTKNPAVVARGKLPPKGVKQILEKKEGLFRMNMMGKRVNFAARSVISPDINIETNEIGVPPVFAKKLTFPEFVTPHNIDRMRQLVINGPNKHPGAVFVQDGSGRMKSLERMSEDQRKAIADSLLAPDEQPARKIRTDVGLPATLTPMVPTRVHRHLDDGDILILNRQPTLHKPSMMCHRARILKGEKTIRMHYANCNSYNADFDGDEMNMHFPQNHIAQAEARTIANNDNQYLVPTSGNPLRGLIQDHVVAGVWMTNKDTFFHRAEYYQIIYGALRTENDYTGGGRILTVPPAIWKPRPLWTGKQIITTILKNIKPANAGGLNLTSASKVAGKNWGIHSAEDSVQFMDGELLCGILDKSQFGASAYGLVHSVYELYGSEVAGRLLSILSRLFTKYLQHRAFSCRMDDLLLTADGDQTRTRLLSESGERGRKAMLGMVGLTEADVATPEGKSSLAERQEEVLRDDMKMAALDSAYKSEMSGLTTAVNNQCLPAGLYKPFPWNNMQLMTGSGAKGSNVNATQISCLLGQQELEGRRVPVMVSGKSLPSFRAFETAPRAGGFVAQRFLTGIRPQEYYFHCMAGREGLIDTAVKTSRSGYLQRCLIKHLEGVSVHYDHTVRNSDSSVLQFHYGDDSLDVTRQKHLYHFEFSVRNQESLIERYRPREVAGRLDDAEATIYMERVQQALAAGEKAPPPVMSVLSPSAHLGATSEKYADEMLAYERANPQRLLKSKKKHRKDWPAYVKSDDLLGMGRFRSLMQIRFLRALVDPGEAVGLLAAQGVGEPSTQMTLNTFHFAGHGAANVTLGIPRLREIVMTASTKIKTPTMKFPIRDEVTDEEVDKFMKRISRLALSQVVDHVVVDEQLTPKVNGAARQKLYQVRLHFYPAKEYSEEYSIKPVAVMACVAKIFVPMLERAIAKEMKERDREAKVQAAEIGKGRSFSARQNAAAEEDEDEGGPIPARRGGDADDAPDDGDADDMRRARQKGELADYDEDDDDDVPEDEAALDKAIGDGDDDDQSSASGDSDASGTWADPMRQGKVGKKRKTDEMIKALEDEVMDFAKFVTKVEFDTENGGYCDFEMQFSARAPKLLLVGMIEKCCVSSVIQEVPGITRCLPAPSDTPHTDKSRYAVTEGANLRQAWQFAYGTGDLQRLYSNDIAAILRTYGVEAARRAIIKEMSGVFGVYGIGVDYRHLTLIADYMTSEGGYKPFNRTGLSNNVSPFLKASYETTASFLMDSALYGDYDDLTSPSANIVLGQAPKVGTRTFDLLTTA